MTVVTTIKLELADEIRVQLTAEQLDALYRGEAAPVHYECVVCRTPGDMRTETTSLIMFEAANRPETVVSFAHARCSPSEVRPSEELLAPGVREAAGSVPSGRRHDVTLTSLSQLRGEVYPTLVIQPGESPQALYPGGERLDVGQDQLVTAGWSLGDATPDLPRWAIRVERGRLSKITRPGGNWWVGDAPLPDYWLQAARKVRAALVLVVRPGTLDDDASTDQRDRIREARDRGEIAAAVIPVRGSTS